MESLEAAIRRSKTYKHALYLVLPSWITGHIMCLEKGLHSLLNYSPKAQTYPYFLAGLFLIAVLLETDTEVFPRLAC